MEFQELFRSWKVTLSLHSLNAPANEQDLLKVESKLTFRLPPPLRDLYLFSNGIQLFRGNLNIYPLFSVKENRALDTASIRCRELFQIPPEVLIFGDNGGDEHYGIWITKPNRELFKFPIIEVGELYEDPACMTVVATDILPFLYGETAFYSLLWETNSDILDIIGLPNITAQG